MAGLKLKLGAGSANGLAVLAPPPEPAGDATNGDGDAAGGLAPAGGAAAAWNAVLACCGRPAG